MPRIVTKTAHGPYELKEADGKKSHFICMCGLSHNQPFCDTSHTKTLDEKDDVTYCYDKDLTRQEMDQQCAGDCACCHKD